MAGRRPSIFSVMGDRAARWTSRSVAALRTVSYRHGQWTSSILAGQTAGQSSPSRRCLALCLARSRAAFSDLTGRGGKGQRGVRGSRGAGDRDHRRSRPALGTARAVGIRDEPERAWPSTSPSRVRSESLSIARGVGGFVHSRPSQRSVSFEGVPRRGGDGAKSEGALSGHSRCEANALALRSIPPPPLRRTPVPRRGRGPGPHRGGLCGGTLLPAPPGRPASRRAHLARSGSRIGHTDMRSGPVRFSPAVTPGSRLSSRERTQWHPTPIPTALSPISTALFYAIVQMGLRRRQRLASGPEPFPTAKPPWALGTTGTSVFGDGASGVFLSGPTHLRVRKTNLLMSALGPTPLRARRFARSFGRDASSDQVAHPSLLSFATDSRSNLVGRGSQRGPQSPDSAATPDSLRALRFGTLVTTHSSVL